MSDITVMPGVELQIEAGVKFEFAPHIGLLVLGRIEALGTLDSPIIFTSINNTQLENNQFNSMIKSNLMFTKLRKPKIVNTNNNHKPTTETYLSVGRITLSTETVRLIGGEQVDNTLIIFTSTLANHIIFNLILNFFFVNSQSRSFSVHSLFHSLKANRKIIIDLEAQ